MVMVMVAVVGQINQKLRNVWFSDYALTGRADCRKQAGNDWAKVFSSITLYEMMTTRVLVE